MRSNNKVNLFLVGAAKSGTTSLFRYFEQHPSFFTTTPKEPRFFAHDIYEQHRLIKTRAEYDNLYKTAISAQDYLVDASPAYMYSSVAAKEIYKYNPQAQIVVMLRRPADLVHSVHAQYLWSCDENIEDFEIAWKMSEQRKKGLSIPRGCSNPQVLIYNEFALLGAQIERYLKVFPREQVHAIVFDDFKENAKACFDRLMKSLDVSAEADINFTPRNLNTVHRSKLLSIILQGKAPGISLLKTLLRPVGIRNIYKIRSLLLGANSKVINRQPLSQSLRMEIELLYEKDVQKLEALLGLDLTAWRSV